MYSCGGSGYVCLDKVQKLGLCVTKLNHSTFSMVISVCFFLVGASFPLPPDPSDPLTGMSIVLRGAEMVDTLNFPRVPLNSTGL